MYILIVAMWAGALAKTDSVAMTATPAAFTSIEACQAAGKKAVDEFTTTFKTVKFVCVKKD